MKRETISFYVIVLTLFAPLTSLKADIVLYDTRSSWEAAVNGQISIETFNSESPFNLPDGIYNTDLIGIELIADGTADEWNSISNDPLFIVDGSTYFKGGFLRGTPDVAVNILLPNPAWAFGGDFESPYSSDGLDFRVNETSFTFSESALELGGTGFWGFVSSDPFSMVTIFNSVQDDSANGVFRLGETFGMDNISFAVPEPITLSLLAFGALLTRKQK